MTKESASGQLVLVTYFDWSYYKMQKSIRQQKT